MSVANYGFPGCFTRPTGDLDSQPSPRIVHVEACRPRGDRVHSSRPQGLETAPGRCDNGGMEERLDPAERRPAAAPGPGAPWPATGATAMPAPWTQQSAGAPPWGEPLPQPAGPAPGAPAPPRERKPRWKRAIGPLIALGLL